MKTHPRRKTSAAMTLIEVLGVIVAIIILIALLLPATARSHKSPMISCINNIRQIDLGFVMYADDNNHKFAIQTSVTNGGTMEFLDGNQTSPHYQKLSSYVRYLRVLVCPADKNRQAAASYDVLTDANLSYFLNADVSTDDAAKSIVIGDRNLAADGKAIPHGTFMFRTNMDLSWTSELHKNYGVLGFVDGHAEMCRKTNLNSLLQHQRLAAMRFSVP